MNARGLQNTFNGGRTDAFVTKVNPSGSSLSYSTYLGGSSEERGASVAVDQVSTVYVAGYTYSPNFRVTSAAYDATQNGSQDGFVERIADLDGPPVRRSVSQDLRASARAPHVRTA